MEYKQPDLPYAMDVLSPVLSKETLEYHYGKHHASYFAKLNQALADRSDLSADLTLTELVCKVDESDTAVFNNAAQALNHSFYWDCLTPDTGTRPGEELLDDINRSFGSMEKLEQQFIAAASGQFGSGWAWIVIDDGGKLAITTTSNAGNPIRDGASPLFVTDVWEHAYYIDYRNDRGAYLKKIWQLTNWDFVTANYTAAVVGETA